MQTASRHRAVRFIQCGTLRALYASRLSPSCGQRTKQLSPTLPPKTALAMLLSPSNSPLPSFSSMAHPTGPPSSTATALPYIPLTLVLCLRPSTGRPSSLQILLGMKKRGFGAGRYNGFGGKLQADETVHQAAVRELHEECGLQAHQLDDVGVVVQRFVDRPSKPPLVIHVMRCQHWQGDATESDEMAPVWFDETAVPYSRMWADDVQWYPLLLRGQCFVADYVMEGMDRVVDGDVAECTAEQLRQWTWEHHSSEQWRASVRFERQHRAGNEQAQAPST